MPIKKIYENSVEYFNEWGAHHREDGPAIESKEVKAWYINGRLHREDGPALEYANGDRSWYYDGRKHREDGPALEWKDGYHILYHLGDRIIYKDLAPTYTWYLNNVSYIRVEDFKKRVQELKEQKSLVKENASLLI